MDSVPYTFNMRNSTRGLNQWQGSYRFGQQWDHAIDDSLHPHSSRHQPLTQHFPVKFPRSSPAMPETSIVFEDRILAFGWHRVEANIINTHVHHLQLATDFIGMPSRSNNKSLFAPFVITPPPGHNDETIFCRQLSKSF